VALDISTARVAPVAEEPTLFIIDGLEPMQHGLGPTQGRLLDPGLRTLLRHLALRTALAATSGGGARSRCCPVSVRKPDRVSGQPDNPDSAP
jgi:hypothetical protein